MTPYSFCTLFDSNYLLKGLAMLESLNKHCPSAHVYVLCMDKETEEVLRQYNLSYISCVSLKDVENEKLLKAKKNRGTAEYCWTLSSSFTWHVLENNRSVDLITYLDADLLFYSPLEPIFNEIGENSIAIIEHRFTPSFKHLEVNGKFCVEWVSFRRDAEGIACLSKWRDQCLDWCYARLENDKMGDQKYLDEWPNLYSKCHIIQHIGAGVAPWNYAQYNFNVDSNCNILVNKVPLIFYHFHQFQILSNGKFHRLSSSYTDECPEPADIYNLYESSLKDLLKKINKIDPSFDSGMNSSLRVKSFSFFQKLAPTFIKNILRKFIKFH